MMRLASLVVASWCMLAIGCSPEADSGASADDVVGGGATDAVTVTAATAKPSWNGCTADIQYLQITGGAQGAIKDKVNAMLADRGTIDARVFTRPTMLTLCSDSRRTGFVRGRMVAKTNGGGLLSIVERLDYADTTKSSAGTLVDVRVRTFTFDLGTGDRLSLSDVFSNAGLAELRRQCVAPAEKLTDGDASTECAMTTERVGGTYTLEREGLRLYPFTLQVLDKGVLLPWTSVGRDVTHAKVAKLARGT